MQNFGLSCKRTTQDGRPSCQYSRNGTGQVLRSQSPCGTNDPPFPAHSRSASHSRNAPEDRGGNSAGTGSDRTGRREQDEPYRPADSRRTDSRLQTPPIRVKTGGVTTCWLLNRAGLTVRSTSKSEHAVMATAALASTTSRCSRRRCCWPTCTKRRTPLPCKLGQLRC
jgi:hypothetical protein